MKQTTLPAEDDTFIRPAEAAKLVGVNVRTLARWEDSGRLTAHRTAGGKRRYRRSDIIALITAQPA
ncbi:DNA binding protein [Mycobacterium phage Daegal]|uniref:DNA binding protein n=1 Tax=Mycobacterium phage Daegal TaxID=2517946 RepID=A0A482MDL6_9CAUD|nr:DNA binding protein [Mycobacterium phage Daegal]